SLALTSPRFERSWVPGSRVHDVDPFSAGVTPPPCPRLPPAGRAIRTTSRRTKATPPSAVEQGPLEHVWAHLVTGLVRPPLEQLAVAHVGVSEPVVGEGWSG